MRSHHAAALSCLAVTLAVAGPAHAQAPTDADGSTLAPWLVAGAGGGALLLGGVFALLSDASYEDAEGAAVHADAAEAADRARGQVTIANLCLLTGSLLVVVGLTWATVELSKADRGVATRLSIGPGTLSLSGAFP